MKGRVGMVNWCGTFFPWACSCVLAAFVVGAGAANAEAPELSRLFPKQASVEVDADGLTRLPLPPEVVGACRPDLSDLRLFDGRNQEVAYLVDGTRGPGVAVDAEQRFEGKVLSVNRSEDGRLLEPNPSQEVYEIEAPPGPPEVGTWELVITTPAKQFVRQVSVERIAPGGESEMLIRKAPLFALDATTRRNRVVLPELRADRIVVTIEGQEGFFLEPSFHFESTRQIAPLDEVVVALEIFSIDAHDGRTVVELVRPSGIVPDSLQFDTSTGSFRRIVTVQDVRPGNADADLGTGTLYRVGTPGGVEHRSVSLRPATGSMLRVEIEDGDSPSLQDLAVRAVVRQPVLIFDLGRGQRSGVLRFGGGRAHHPHYDLSGLLLGARRKLSGDPARAAASLYDHDALGVAKLGPIRRNEQFDPSPALAFAMHAGAPIDRRQFARRRALSIDPSPEGLSRLLLEPADIAVMRPDYGDARIVDSDDQQWPYLLVPRAETRTVEMSIAAVESDEGTTSYRFEPPIAPLPLRGLRFETDSAYFHRPFELYAVDEDGESWLLTKGSLVKDARNPRPASLAFGDQHMHALELRVTDGDDAPLALRDATAKIQLPEVYLVAPAGSYALLVGNPAESRPSYELERVRNVVLAVASNPVATGPLEENPAYSARSRLAPGSSAFQKAVVWIVVLAAAAVLGLLTLRIARQEPDPNP